MMNLEIKNAVAVRCWNHLTAYVECMRTHTKRLAPHRNVYYSVFYRFLQAEKALDFVVFAFCRL